MEIRLPRARALFNATNKKDSTTEIYSSRRTKQTLAGFSKLRTRKEMEKVKMTASEISQRLASLVSLTNENLRDQVNDSLLRKELDLAHVEFLGTIALELAKLNDTLRIIQQNVRSLV
jgi:hypothetical protein